MQDIFKGIEYVLINEQNATVLYFRPSLWKEMVVSSTATVIMGPDPRKIADTLADFSFTNKKTRNIQNIHRRTSRWQKFTLNDFIFSTWPRVFLRATFIHSPL